MSHFTVLVIGENPDQQLTPYDESCCTDPNLAKWDWYTLGGRWRGYFKLKRGAAGKQGCPGVFDNPPEHDVDSCRLCDIDVEGMRDAAGEAAGVQWDKIRGVINRHLDSYVSWPAMLEKHHDNVEMARDEYAEQPLIRALNVADIFLFDGPEEFIKTSREAYVENARLDALTTFAVVKDGQWHERGSMGWWGLVADEKDKDEWRRQFNSLLDALPPETQVSLYDCHI